jgi:protein TonB
VRCGATTVALLGHIAILLALAYDPTHDPSLLEPVAAIAVEIVFVPPANAAAALTPPVVTLDQADTSVTELVHTDRDSKRLREMNEEPAPISKPERIDAVVLPPKPALRKTAAVRPAPPAKRRDVPVAVAQVSEATGAANGPPGGSSGMIGSAVSISDVPSTWKNRLLSHLDRYKRYPDAARARRAEGTALLSFGMDRDGRVLGYYLVRSSGYPELDDEVLSMIERASPLPPAPPEIRAQVVQLVVPVRFRM